MSSLGSSSVNKPLQDQEFGLGQVKHHGDTAASLPSAVRRDRVTDADAVFF